MGFMDENFLLRGKTARELFHNHAKDMPIIDYHCHLNPKEIAEDKRFDCIGEAWLAGDHYKWRALRTNGVSEDYCTGARSFREKFIKWAETIHVAIRNPLHHWSHLELQRYFGVYEPLGPKTAGDIYEKCSAMLRTPEFSARNLMLRSKVKLVCTTDDPVDSLEYHKQLRAEGFAVRVLPTFRPDKAMAVDKPGMFPAYIKTLAEVSGVEISSFARLIEAIDKRHAYFHDAGCRLSDHGIEYVPAAEATAAELDAILQRGLRGEAVTPAEAEAFKAVFLYEAAKMNHARGWVQQFHVGVFRNNNTRLFKALGPDTGFDSIADYRQGPGLIKLFDRLDSSNQLAKTILYNINPVDNELFATMIGNYQDGSCPGKMQYGSAWWFLDQKDGMIKQMNALSALGLLSRFVGMLTDSRSFLSYPRHEYFRRIMCNLLGEDADNGEVPLDMELLGGIVRDISYNNAVNYFGIKL